MNQGGREQQGSQRQRPAYEAGASLCIPGGRRFHRPPWAFAQGGFLHLRFSPIILCMKEIPTKKIQTLAQIAADLAEGQNFNITRLTILKGLCADPDAAAKFALHIAKLAQKKMKVSKPTYKRLIAAGVRVISRHLKTPTEKTEERLWDLFTEAKEAQSRCEHQQWADVRIIKCWELLIVETALECVLRPWASSVLGYQVARKYAEKFDSRFGSGLIPKSAGFVEEIAEFWGRYYLGRGWRKKLGSVSPNH